MSKELIFLQCSEARTKESFVARKVHNLIHIPLKGKETFDDLFAALELEFKGNDEKLKALKDFDAHFSTIATDDVRTMEVLDIIPEPDVKMFAIFDLMPA